MLVIASLSLAGGVLGTTCDVFAKGGTPCVAAHSTVRALYSRWVGRDSKARTHARTHVDRQRNPFPRPFLPFINNVSGEEEAIVTRAQFSMGNWEMRDESSMSRGILCVLAQSHPFRAS